MEIEPVAVNFTRLMVVNELEGAPIMSRPAARCSARRSVATAAAAVTSFTMRGSQPGGDRLLDINMSIA
jgi:hypothetical protein